MAESIVFNNATYIIPDVGESNWGQNLTNYFVAIPQGAYQASGGTMPLTADLSFGTNFGLLSKYFKSVTANIASTGQVRLANADTIDWRNAANNADLALAVNGSNQLTFNGNIIPTDTTSVTAKSFIYGDASGLIASTSNPTNGQLLIGSTGAIPVVAALTGTASQVIVTNAAGTITLSTPQNIATTSTPTFASETLTATTNQLILGTTNTITLSSTAPSASRVYVIPDAGAGANVVLDQGNYTIAGTWSFSNTITLASSKAVIFTDNSTNTVTMQATNSTTSWTLKLPTTHGSSNQFLQTDGSGNTTWANGGAGTVTSGTAGNLTLYPATAASVNDTYVQNSQNITIGIAAQASRSAGLVITVPNPGNAVTTTNIVLDKGNYTLGGVYTFSGGAGAITMSSSTIAMGANKITGLANGSAAQDAVAFTQILGFRILQVVSNSTATLTSSSSSTFADATNLNVTITPTLSTSTVWIVAVVSYGIAAAANTRVPISLRIVRGAATVLALYQQVGNLGGGATGIAEIGGGTATLFYPDSPATTSATTYKIQLASFNSNPSVKVNDNVDATPTSYIYAIEVG